MSRRTPKVEALVVNAIRRLQDVQGSTSREISNYISQEYDIPGKEIRQQVQLALQRGLSYGILQRSKGGYYSCNRNCLEELPLGDATGDRVMEPCPWRRRRFGTRRGRRGRGRRSRRGRRRSRSRARLRRRRSRRPRRRRKSRRTTNRNNKKRMCADNDEVEMETMAAEPSTKENDASKDEDFHRSETSESEHSEQQLQDSPQNSRTLNTPDDA